MAMAEQAAADKDGTGADATHIGAVGLVARELTRMIAFYRDVLGLELMTRSEGEAALGAGGATLLCLREDRDALPDDPRQAGLFHTAFLLPSRADLGSWLNRASEIGLALDGAADHLVSEAVYLSDPEGNGIEIYTDRPRAAWRWPEGEVEMATLPLDLRVVAGAAEGRWDGAPHGTRVGHIHLRVGSIDEADAFYRGVLGMDVANAGFPGARFFSRQGYHHHVGTNIWRSRGAGPRDPSRAGLDWFELALEPDGYAAVRDRLGQAGEVADPWGTRIRLVPAG